MAFPALSLSEWILICSLAGLVFTAFEVLENALTLRSVKKRFGKFWLGIKLFFSWVVSLLIFLIREKWR